MPQPKRSIHGLTRSELTEFFNSQGLPRFRADQLWRWLYGQRVTDWQAMTNLPVALRETLSQTFNLTGVTEDDRASSPEDTRKLLARLPDGDAVETVLIPAAGRRTVCVSTQVGCRFHCTFCASGQAGFRRQLDAGEIVGQVLLAARARGERPTHVVYMGIGEPFDNYDAVMRSVRIVNDPDGLGIGARRITISTCGLVPGIERLATEGIQVELSVSLHAADDDLRSRLIPVNRQYPLDSLLPACAAYTRHTNRIVTFEYALIAGINDGADHARHLADVLRPFPCRVNLIPLSGVTEFDGASSNAEHAELFVAVLADAGTNATIRTSRGAGVQAACGQLRFHANKAETSTS